MSKFVRFAVALLALPVLFGQAPKKIQTLIITGQNAHDWRGVTPVMRKILEDSGRFEVRVTEEFRGATAETLAPYDLVILNYFDSKKPELRWGAQTDNAFLNYVRGGKGVVMFHFSTAAFIGWEEYEKLSGGNWRPNNGQHSARHDFTVTVRDDQHPILKGYRKSFPQLNDELYANLKWQPEGSYHVLATAWDDHSLYKGKARQPIPGPGIDQPMLWVLNYGQGRVFGDALGHDAEAMKTAGFISTLLRGAEWAATGTVTIPVPAELAQ